ncbi:MAG: hypothetical protein PHS41_01270 [Victivallaceae bacterium]|nr:hypothetical protein [Victivallaceae bacterium]
MSSGRVKRLCLRAGIVFACVVGAAAVLFGVSVTPWGLRHVTLPFLGFVSGCRISAGECVWNPKSGRVSLRDCRWQDGESVLFTAARAEGRYSWGYRRGFFFSLADLHLEKPRLQINLDQPEQPALPAVVNVPKDAPIPEPSEGRRSNPWVIDIRRARILDGALSIRQADASVLQMEQVDLALCCLTPETFQIAGGAKVSLRARSGTLLEIPRLALEGGTKGEDQWQLRANAAGFTALIDGRKFHNRDLQLDASGRVDAKEYRIGQMLLTAGESGRNPDAILSATGVVETNFERGTLAFEAHSGELATATVCEFLLGRRYGQGRFDGKGKVDFNASQLQIGGNASLRLKEGAAVTCLVSLEISGGAEKLLRVEKFQFRAVDSSRGDCTGTLLRPLRIHLRSGEIRKGAKAQVVMRNFHAGKLLQNGFELPTGALDSVLTGQLDASSVDGGGNVDWSLDAGKLLGSAVPQSPVTISGGMLHGKLHLSYARSRGGLRLSGKISTEALRLSGRAISRPITPEATVDFVLGVRPEGEIVASRCRMMLQEKQKTLFEVQLPFRYLPGKGDFSADGEMVRLDGRLLQWFGDAPGFLSSGRIRCRFSDFCFDSAKAELEVGALQWVDPARLVQGHCAITLTRASGKLQIQGSCDLAHKRSNVAQLSIHGVVPDNLDQPVTVNLSSKLLDLRGATSSGEKLPQTQEKSAGSASSGTAAGASEAKKAQSLPRLDFGPRRVILQGQLDRIIAGRNHNFAFRFGAELKGGELLCREFVFRESAGQVAGNFDLTTKPDGTWVVRSRAASSGAMNLGNLLLVISPQFDDLVGVLTRAQWNLNTSGRTRTQLLNRLAGSVELETGKVVLTHHFLESVVGRIFAIPFQMIDKIPHAGVLGGIGRLDKEIWFDRGTMNLFFGGGKGMIRKFELNGKIVRKLAFTGQVLLADPLGLALTSELDLLLGGIFMRIDGTSEAPEMRDLQISVGNDSLEKVGEKARTLLDKLRKLR